MKKGLLIFVMLLLVVGTLASCDRMADFFLETPPIEEIPAPIPVPEPEVAPSAESEYSIQVHRATDEFLSQYGAYHEFLEIDTQNNRSAVSATREQFGLNYESAQRIVFTTDTHVWRFSFVEADARLHEWQSYGNDWSMYFLDINALHWQDEFTPEIPIVITWDTWMSAPHRWISIIHHISDGSEWGRFEETFFSIQLNGDDISLIQIEDLPSVLYAEFGDRIDHEFNHDMIWERPPRTNVIGILGYPDLTVESVAIYMDSWILANQYRWRVYGGWNDVYEVQETHEAILQKHADSIVYEDEWSATVRKMLSQEDAAFLHYTLRDLEAVEALTPAHSGHPKHADPVFRILISYTSGTYEWIRTGEWGAFFFRLMGTFTDHGDEAFVGGVNENLYHLLISYFV